MKIFKRFKNIRSLRIINLLGLSGVFKDIPETSHFHTDLLFHRPEKQEDYAYFYLLLKKQATIQELEQKITHQIILEAEKTNEQVKVRASLMPLTDIHLHSHLLREMEPNGNSYYIYLVIGANLLLMIVVMFNLWLNSSLIFSYNQRYYQLIRMNGALSSTVIKDETLLALILGGLSSLTGILFIYYISANGYFPAHILPIEALIICLIFIILIVLVSLLPVFASLSSTLFLNSNHDSKPVQFSYSNVKGMLTVQYTIVMIIVILAFGINKQMNMVKDTQVGGNERTILVMKEQPEKVKERYSLLKAELLKYPEIKAVTASMQLPGDAIRDATQVFVGDSEEMNFAYHTSLDWWIFALSGLFVLLISVLSVSIQSWRAATVNPVDAIKTE